MSARDTARAYDPRQPVCPHLGWLDDQDGLRCLRCREADTNRVLDTLLRDEPSWQRRTLRTPACSRRPWWQTTDGDLNALGTAVLLALLGLVLIACAVIGQHRQCAALLDSGSTAATSHCTPDQLREARR